MGVNKVLQNLTEEDLYSLMLFVLYKSSDIPEYSSLSQLSYILDKPNLLKLCQFYGGLTIKIPTISQLESLLNGMLLYQLVDVEHKPLEEEMTKFNKDAIIFYGHIKKVLKSYSFNSGRNND